MRALIQRVTEASVTVDDAVIGRIGPGLLILVCAMRGDDTAAADKLAAKIARLRIFSDAEGRMNRNLRDAGGAALVVSQFTLAADTSRGNRPGFSAAAPPPKGNASTTISPRACKRSKASPPRPAALAPTWRSRWSMTARSPCGWTRTCPNIRHQQAIAPKTGAQAAVQVAGSGQCRSVKR